MLGSECNICSHWIGSVLFVIASAKNHSIIYVPKEIQWNFIFKTLGWTLKN